MLVFGGVATGAPFLLGHLLLGIPSLGSIYLDEQHQLGLSRDVFLLLVVDVDGSLLMVDG